ncbi:MAG: efflux RND transporter permease subunit, partial [Muribaculum sp.]|nr:efflux RND transporter permease subunit [Muribaculum sp.]
PPENIFERIFSSSDPVVDIRLSPKTKESKTLIEDYTDIRQHIDTQTSDSSIALPTTRRISIVINDELLSLYNIDYNKVATTLRRAFQNSTITTLRSFNQYMPIGFGYTDKTLEQILEQTLIPVKTGNATTQNYIPLSAIVEIDHTDEFSRIIAGKSGEYLSISYPETDSPERIVTEATQIIKDDGRWDVEFSGQYFDNRRMVNEMVWILIVSLLLMFFILCAQFESFVQPLIVLLEIPIDTAFALLTLWIFGYTINLMSAIGIIVTCGIVVNDSILKLDAINRLRATGMPLIDAIHTAGRRRLRPILMTSLTTILAMVPMLFTSDMGSELQRPLAVAMIGSMIVGTLVSIFIIPLIYYLIYRNAKN